MAEQHDTTDQGRSALRSQRTEDLRTMTEEGLRAQAKIVVVRATAGAGAPAAPALPAPG